MTYQMIVADSQPVVRAGVASFVAGSEIKVVDEAQDCEQTFSKTLEVQPDALVLCERFADGWGFDVASSLRDRGYRGRVVFFSEFERQTFFARALASGADSYLLKRTERQEFLRIVKGLLRRPIKYDDRGRPKSLSSYSGELKRVSNTIRRTSLEILEPLTARETQILRNIAVGLSNKEIAALLRLSVDTVKEHAQRIFRKLDVSDRTQAAVFAVQKKLIN